MRSLLLNELLERIKTNCKTSNHELTVDQIDDIADILSPFANRFDAMETICEMVQQYGSQLGDDIQNQLDVVFPER